MALTADKLKSLKVGDKLWQSGSGTAKEVDVIAIGPKHFHTHVSPSQGKWSLSDGSNVLSRAGSWRELWDSQEMHEQHKQRNRMQSAVARFFYGVYLTEKMTDDELKTVHDICAQVTNRMKQ